MLYLLSQFQQKEAAEKKRGDSLSEQEKQLQERLRFQVGWLEAAGEGGLSLGRVAVVQGRCRRVESSDHPVRVAAGGGRVLFRFEISLWVFLLCSFFHQVSEGE